MKRLAIFTVSAVLLGLMISVVAELGFEAALKCASAVLFGWIWFLVDVVPRMTVDMPSILMGPVALVLFVIGFHYFLRSLGARSLPSEDRAGSKWRWRSTSAVSYLILFAFVTGTAMVGVVHEILWLSTSKEPWITKVWEQSEVEMRMHDNDR